MRKRNLTKSLALVMAVSTGLAGIGTYPLNAKADIVSGTEDVQQYVIKLDAADTYEKISEEYKTSIIDDNITEVLKDENIMVAEMTEDEAAELANTNGVETIEKDVFVTGSTISNNVDDKEDVFVGTDGENIHNISDIGEDGSLYINEEPENTDISEEDKKNIEWSLDVINANNGEYSVGKEPVKVAVLDSGVVATADIDVSKRINLISGDENIEPLFEDFSGHGTAIASIIAGKDNGDGVTGVNPDAQIYSVKVLDEDNRASVSRIAEGIYKCIDENADIINMSFGTTTDSEILHQAVKAAEDAGILMVAAAGNRGESDKQVEYPAAYPEVLAVGATGTDAELSGISSDGEEVEVLAPGENVAVLGIWDEVNLMDGTSLSTAEVTGAASVLLSMDKSKSPEFIRSLLNTASNQNVGTGNAGIIDLSYAISVYDEFVGKFHEQDTEGIVNTREVKTYDEGDVEASWKTAYHETIFDGYEGLSDSARRVIKKGLIYPDKYKYNLERVQALNGFRNYIGDYIYLAQLARNTYMNGLKKALEDTKHPLGTGNTNGKESVQDVKNYIAAIDNFSNENKGGVGGTWTDILGYSAGTVTEEKLRNDQGRFIIGLAVHSAMDAYSHRGRVQGIPYDGTQADFQTLTGGNYTQKQKEAFALRWTVAKKVAEAIMGQWKGEHSFSILQFHRPAHTYVEGHEDETSTMQHFLAYAKNSDGSDWSGRKAEVQKFFSDRTE